MTNEGVAASHENDDSNQNQSTMPFRQSPHQKNQADAKGQDEQQKELVEEVHSTVGSVRCEAGAPPRLARGNPPFWAWWPKQRMGRTG